ncbi:tetratricopeptide repeat protein [Planktothrix rubescens]|uniref:tetratricopeptide repeat protein n=1 Tax=Planktothrix rubescens TaxID=59512 RepID=UPI0011DE522B|nr:tetratricopeptide repeat protein [Planktothrix rubescens]
MGNEVMSPGQLLKQANQLKRMGKLDEAIATHHQAIQNNPKFHWSHYYLGKALEDQGRLDEAILWYCQAIEINPQFFPGYCRLGQTFYLLTQQNQELSFPHYQAIASRVEPNFATERLLLDDQVFLEKTKHLNNEEFLRQIYLTYLGREADVQGLQDHLQSLEVSNPISRKDMIELNFRNCEEFANVTRFSKLEIVVNIYKKALDIVPDSCSVYYKLALALEAQNKWEEAIEVYRKILEINPAFVPAVNQLKILFHIVVQTNLITEIKRIIPNQFLTYKKQRNYYSGRTSSSPNKYLFIHIPKTAGSLINHIIGQLFLPEECLLFLFNDGLYDRYKRHLEANQFKQLKFFAGHLSYDFSHLIDADYKITFLRNPIDRVLSHYFYYRKVHINCNMTIDFNGNPCPLIDYNLPWEEDLLRHLAAPVLKSLEFINLQTWQLAFNIYNRPHEIGSDREVLSMAKQHLDDFNFVGIYERLNSDLARLFQEQGWQLPEQLERVNATIERKQISEVDSHIIDVIRSRNALDIELYDYALNKFGSIL